MSKSRLKTRTDPAAAILPPGVTPFLMKSVEGCWHRVDGELTRNRRRCTEPGIHDLRVALRRLLAVLDLADAVLPGEVGTRPVRVLRRTLRSFSPLRDCHIRILALRALTRRFTVARPMLREAGLAEKELIREAARVIARFDTSAFERELSPIALSLASIEDTPERSSAASAVLAGVAARKYLRVTVRAGKLSAGNTKTIHRLRVAFKEFRYAMEALRPLFHGPGNVRMRPMRSFQDSMGEIQDIEVLIASVGRFAVTRGAAFPASVLNLQRHLAQRRLVLVNSFMKEAAGVTQFWPYGAPHAVTPALQERGSGI